MIEDLHLRVPIIIILLTSLSFTLPTIALSSRNLESDPVMRLAPSLTRIKVGDIAKINVTLTNPQNSSRKVCLGVDGFPTSGFITSFVTPCPILKPFGAMLSVLNVEATPAAAPQSFTAFVVAISLNWTARSPISITVEPAMPAWIPWSIVLVFTLMFIIPLVVKTKKKADSGTKKSSKR